MTGLPNNNWDAFFAKERQLEVAGWEVINPARMDKEKGINPPSDYDYEDCARRDIEALITCQAIYMLSGFQFSKGACWERALAKHLNLKRYYEVPRAEHEFANGEYNFITKIPGEPEMDEDGVDEGVKVDEGDDDEIIRDYLKDTIELPVRIEGTICSRVVAPTDSDMNDIQDIILTDKKVIEALAGREVRMFTVDTNTAYGVGIRLWIN